MTKTVVRAREADTINRLMSEMTKGNDFVTCPWWKATGSSVLALIGDAIKLDIAQMGMEAAATRQYTAG